MVHTPESQVKLYAGITGKRNIYTPKSQVKLYAKVTGQCLDSLQH
ncbi:hypothetical protein [Chlorogloeopsis sp. ULAP02]